MDSRTLCEKYAVIGRDLIENEPELEYIKRSKATISYLSSEHKKKADGKLILGQCEKISEKYKWSIPCDFTITIFEPNVEGFTDEQLRILIFHELLHVKIELSDNGEEVYSTKGHDLEDFKLIIDRFGTDWAKVDEEM